MNSPITSPREPLELWTRATVLKFFGGEKPIHVATLYRGMKGGRYPRPIFVTGNTARWLGHECRDAVQRMVAERDTRKPRDTPKPQLTRPWRRGRPRKAAADSAEA